MHELAPTARVAGDGSVSAFGCSLLRLFAQCTRMLRKSIEAIRRVVQLCVSWSSVSFAGGYQSEPIAPFHLLGGQRGIFMKAAKRDWAPTTPKLTNLTTVLASRKMNNLTSTFCTKRINRFRTKWPISRSISHLSRAARNDSIVCP
jgi:hypothetical protein